jgi:hypothetical protein
VLVKRKLNGCGFYDIKDGRSLRELGFYNIRGIGEIATIEEFTERAFNLMRRARQQTVEEVAALKRKYNRPIFGEVSLERLLELEAQVIDPTNILMFTGSQLTHTLQVLESMERAGIADREFLATTLIHDLGKLASLTSETWENLESGGKLPIGENAPGSGLEACTFSWDHSDVVHARFYPYVSRDMAWLLKWHSIQKTCEPLMDAHDRALFEKYYKPFIQHDRTYIFQVSSGGNDGNAPGVWSLLEDSVLVGLIQIPPWARLSLGPHTRS